ncbi:MAG: sodium-dependent bicarbonate transport family permease [Candidatus Babeliales bacterium]
MSLLSNFVSPPILFFFLGLLASFLRVDLKIPQPIPKFLSLYLLLVIGFNGGVELHEAGIDATIAVTLLAAIGMALFVPCYTYFIARTRLNVYDSAAMGATYGSVSAITFITATSFLNSLGIAFGGYMVACLALMESPAIIVGLWFVQKYAPDEEGRYQETSVWREALLNSSVFLIMGSLIIGMITGVSGQQELAPFTQGIFKGMLCLFMLDMGLLAAKRMVDVRYSGLFLVACGLVIPLINALLGIGISYMLSLSTGDMLLFTVLCAGASYIAVPAALRLAVPEANPGYYLPMALGITFPFNILIGLPLYLYIIQLLKG